LHVHLAHHPELHGNTVKAIHDSFMSANDQWTNTVNHHNLSTIAGSTGVIALLKGSDLYVAWAGDSSAILFLQNGVWFDFVTPHKPSIPVSSIHDQLILFNHHAFIKVPRVQKKRGSFLSD
jgi:serine/threonine protein phosphatase PrpC